MGFRQYSTPPGSIVQSLDETIHYLVVIVPGIHVLAKMLNDNLNCIAIELANCWVGPSVVPNTVAESCNKLPLVGHGLLNGVQ